MLRKSVVAISALLACACATTASSDRTDDGLVITKRVNPVYPRVAVDQAIVGCTSVSFIVRPDGTADEYQIVASEPKGVFDRTTLEALNQWRFEPTPGRHVQTIEYRLQGKADGPNCGRGGKT